MTPTKLRVMKKSVQMKILSVITVCDDTEKPTIVDQINEAAGSECARGVNWKKWHKDNGAILNERSVHCNEKWKNNEHNHKKYTWAYMICI